MFGPVYLVAPMASLPAASRSPASAQAGLSGRTTGVETQTWAGGTNVTRRRRSASMHVLTTAPPFPTAWTDSAPGHSHSVGLRVKRALPA